MGLNQGCSISNFFSNKYKNIVSMQILLNNRRMTSKNYCKTVERGQKMLEIDYDNKIAIKYKNGIKTNKDLKNKIKSLSNNDMYLPLINHTIILNIRKQFNLVPIKQNIKTFIFDQLTNNIEIIRNHNLKDEKTKKIKNLYTIDQAILEHYKTNMEKITINNEIINQSNIGLVNVDYEIDILDSTIFSKNRIKKLSYILNL